MTAHAIVATFVGDRLTALVGIPSWGLEAQGLFSALAGKRYEQPADNYLMTSLAIASVCVTISLILSNNVTVNRVFFFVCLFICQPSLSHTQPLQQSHPY